MILAPLMKSSQRDEETRREKDDPSSVGFRAAYVFDVSQTEGEDIQWSRRSRYGS